MIAKYIGHRGGCGYAPENTLAAFKRAAGLGYQWVEFDVCLSADDVVVVIHDDSVDRTMNGCGKVREMSFEQLQGLRAKEFVGEGVNVGDGAEYCVPSLEEVLSHAAYNGLGVNVELKPLEGEEALLVDRVVECLTRWPGDLPVPLVSSFNFTCMELLQPYQDRFQFGLLLKDWRDDWLELAQKFHATTVHLSKKCLITGNWPVSFMQKLLCKFRNCTITNLDTVLGEKRVAEIKQAGYTVLCYTVNDYNESQVLFSIGVDGIFTDCLS